MCQDCREANLKRKREQFEEPKERRHNTGTYPSKSKKVWRDRFEAARKDLKRAIEWYARARERGYEDSWLYQRLGRNDWYPKRYRQARADARKHGAL